MARTATARRGSSQIWYRTLALAVLAAAIYSGMTVGGALTATDLGGGTESIRLGRETFANGFEDIVDADNHQLVLQVGNETAVGDSAPGVDVNKAPYPDVRTDLTDGNYTYVFDLHEPAIGSWQDEDDLRIQVYGYDGVDTTLLGTLYAKQDFVRENKVEGVTVSIDSGTTDEYALTFSIVLSRQ